MITYQGINIPLTPFTPHQVREDEIKLKAKIEKRR